jgi:hypothetical protein
MCLRVNANAGNIHPASAFIYNQLLIIAAFNHKFKKPLPAAFTTTIQLRERVI